jgi:hypothetical protein
VWVGAKPDQSPVPNDLVVHVHLEVGQEFRLRF